jgi:P4 family phage/plasmid primase-like protien
MPIDLGIAEAFIAALTGSADTPVTFQCFDDDEERKTKGQARKALTKILGGSLRERLVALSTLNDAGAGIFITINKGRDLRDRKDANIVSLRACFTDDDLQGPPPVLSIKPSITVKSSAEGKRHRYWLLKPNEDVTRFKDVQHQLAAFFGTDKAVCNVGRVMRLPGSWHHKTKTPFLVALEDVDIRRVYTLDNLLAAYGSTKAPPPTKAIARAEEADLTDEQPEPEQPTPFALGIAARVRSWLSHERIEHEALDPCKFRLKRCVFNPAHVDKMVIGVRKDTGAHYAICFHDSCNANLNMWTEAKVIIGGFSLLRGGFDNGSERELAQRMLRDLRFDENVPLVYDEGELYRYAPTIGIWEKVTELAQSRELQRYDGKAFGQRGRVKISGSMVKGACNLAKAQAETPRFFETAPHGIAFTNGFLHLDETARVRFCLAPLGAENRARTRLPFSYTPESKCPRFLQYFDEVFVDDEDRQLKINLLQEFAGACLVGIATRYQKAIILTGEGNNGKGVIVDVLFALFPDVARAAITPQTFGKDCVRAKLAGVRLNAVSELPESEILATESFKAIITGDPIEGRHLFKPPITFRPVAGHIYSANRLPGTNDHSFGFWRRLLPIAFNRCFSEAEAVKGLGERIAQTELAGVAAWAVAGIERLLTRGHYETPPSTLTALDRWRLEADPVALFLLEWTEPDHEGAGIFAAEFYEAFCYWAERTGHRRISNITFGKRLRGLGHMPRITERGTRYTFRLLGAARPTVFQ